MTDVSARLQEQAKQAIAEYNAQIKEGEPTFPQWAHDILELIDEHAALVARITREHAIIVASIKEHRAAEIGVLQLENARKDTTIATISNALSYAEKEGAHYRCEYQRVENELRWAKEESNANAQVPCEPCSGSGIARKGSVRSNIPDMKCRHCIGTGFRRLTAVSAGGSNG